MAIKAGTQIEIHLYARPLEDMDFLIFTEDLHEKYPYWRFQNESYRELETDIKIRLNKKEIKAAVLGRGSIRVDPVKNP